MRFEDTTMLWVDAWNDVYDIIDGRKDYPCVLPDWSRVDVDACLGWLQDSVCHGFDVTVKRGWWKGHPAVVVDRKTRPAG